MLASTQLQTAATTGQSDLYGLIGEGRQAMLDGRVSTMEEVKEELRKRREESGPRSIY